MAQRKRRAAPSALPATALSSFSRKAQPCRFLGAAKLCTLAHERGAVTNHHYLPQGFPDCLLVAGCPASGCGRTESAVVLQSGFTTAQPSGPTRSEPHPALMMPELHQAARLSRRRELRTTFAQPSEKIRSAASSRTAPQHDWAAGQRRSSTAHRPQPNERPGTDGHQRTRLHLLQHAAYPYTLESGTLEYGHPPWLRALCAARRALFASGATGPPSTSSSSASRGNQPPRQL